METLNEVTTSRLEQTGAWYVVRKNKLKKNGEPMEARSCRQAVKVRDRLGSGETGGVPLWSELKSEVGVAECEVSGTRRYYACHTRANTILNRERLAEALELDPQNCSFSRIIDEDGDDKDEIDFFGLVNPLNVDQIMKIVGLDCTTDEIWQLIDDSVFWEEGYPNTLVTNCGRRDMALEMFSSGLFRSLTKYFPRTKRGSFSDFDPIWLGKSGNFVKKEWLNFPPPKAPKIGVLTGNSPESGITLVNEFFQEFRKIFEANATDVTMPEIHMHSAPSMGLTMELIEREERVWTLIEQDLRQLLEAGCKILTIPCNTTIYFSDKIRSLCSSYDAEFVSIAEACLPVLERVGDTEVGLIGIAPVVDFDRGFSGYDTELSPKGYRILPCNGEALAWEVKNRGDNIRKFNQPYQSFEKLVSKQFDSVRTIILALTEVSLVYRENVKRAHKKFPETVFVDPLLELSKYLLFRYLSTGLRESKVCALPRDFEIDNEIQELIFEDPA
ncbi:aspartate/glutamate racemase family protein [Pontivivens ytuae]|uniref:Aspartate/glutamate racemase family protein n=1 Tax=Pontivivens ytuae TaxID=2789856 RepID=A0A7S9QF07_9RHOB|nr:aspartate/glutamate racemase family protein [Pontivivens ytuae]QPH56017.1 aspartate/glutamate racemase family protein [Pontivivens ytuae]